MNRRTALHSDPEKLRAWRARSKPPRRRKRIPAISERHAEKQAARGLGTELKAHVERLPCLLAGRHVCRGDVVAHHVVHKNHAGDRLPDGTGNLVPLCAIAGHQGGPESVHVMGRASFERQWGIDLAAEAARIGDAFGPPRSTGREDG